MFSYGENNSLKLDEYRVCQLTGVNGVGKTSVALILQELLFNKNVKGIKKGDILNRYSSSKSWDAKLLFSVDNDEYEIYSKRLGASTKVTIKKNKVEISEHKVLDTYRELAQILGCDFETFSQLTFQSSTDILEFLKATDTNRKKFLISLFNLEKYLEIGDSLKASLGSAEKTLSEKQGELRTVEQFLSSNTLPSKGAEILVPDVDRTLLPVIESVKQTIHEYKSVCAKIDKNNNLKTQRDSLVFRVDLLKPEKPLSETNQYSTLKEVLHTKAANLTRLVKDLKALDLTDHCYACKQPIDNSKAVQLVTELQKQIDDIKAEIASAEAELKKCEKVIKAYERALREYEDNETAIAKFTNLSQLIDNSLSSDAPNYKDLLNQLAYLEKEYSSQVRAQEEARKHNESIKIRNAKIDMLKDQIREFKARQELVKNDIVKIQDKISYLTVLKKAFSTSGIVAFKLENVAKQLESSINEYLTVLSDGQFQLLFRLTGEKLNIVIINNGIEVSIDSLSGGEFSRVQTSVLLAVRSTLSKIGGKHINLLFLDEIMAVLDDAGKEKLIEVLQEEQNLNVFLISHEYAHPLIPKIEIQKKDNISYIHA
jgi:DNA repair exonuclease SbcCD ATPase subunit